MKYIALDCYKQCDHATMIDTETGEIKSKRLAQAQVIAKVTIIHSVDSSSLQIASYIS